uniref:Gamma-tubulin complex component n=1 Tax=Glossina brevipalpis TaxID=37001 RepID=A0A1A9WEJ3_9MUSC
MSLAFQNAESVKQTLLEELQNLLSSEKRIRQSSEQRMKQLEFTEERLCKSFVSTRSNHRYILRHITQYISNNPSALDSTLLYDDEVLLVAKIAQHLSITENAASQSRAKLFLSLHERLKATQLDSYQRNALLIFLYYMIDTKYSCENDRNIYCGITGASRNHNHLSYKSNASLPPNNATQLLKPHTLHKASPIINNATNIAAPHLSLIGIKCVSNIQHNASSDTNHKMSLLRQTNIASKNSYCSESESSTLPANIRTHMTPLRSGPDMYKILEAQNNLNDDIVQNVIYAFTGIPGEYLKKDVISAELGYYHDLVQSYTDNKSGRCALGLMGQGFVSALKNQLTKYYGMVVMLQDQLNKQRQTEMFNYYSHIKPERLSLMKILVWSVDALKRLQLLANVAEACQEKKGGALASTV